MQSPSTRQASGLPPPRYAAGFWVAIPAYAASFWVAISSLVAHFWVAVPVYAAGFWVAIPSLVAGFWVAIPVYAAGFWIAIPSLVADFWVVRGMLLGCHPLAGSKLSGRNPRFVLFSIWARVRRKPMHTPSGSVTRGARRRRTEHATRRAASLADYAIRGARRCRARRTRSRGARGITSLAVPRPSRSHVARGAGGRRSRSTAWSMLSGLLSPSTVAGSLDCDLRRMKREAGL